MFVPPDALTVVDPSLCDMNDIYSLPDLIVVEDTEYEYMFFDRLYLTPSFNNWIIQKVVDICFISYSESIYFRLFLRIPRKYFVFPLLQSMLWIKGDKWLEWDITQRIYFHFIPKRFPKILPISIQIDNLAYCFWRIHHLPYTQRNYHKKTNKNFDKYAVAVVNGGLRKLYKRFHLLVLF